MQKVSKLFSAFKIQNIQNVSSFKMFNSYLTTKQWGSMHAQFFWVKNARLSLEKLWIFHIRGCVGIPQFFSKNTVSEANGPQQRCLVPKTEGNNQLQCNCKRGIPAINKSSQVSIRIIHRSQHCTTPVLNKPILLSTPLSLPMKLSPSLPFSILEEYEREASKLRNEHR